MIVDQVDLVVVVVVVEKVDKEEWVKIDLRSGHGLAVVYAACFGCVATGSSRILLMANKATD